MRLVGTYTSAMLLGLLISSFSMASETLALIESSALATQDLSSTSVEGIDDWNDLTLNPTDELMGNDLLGQSLYLDELNEAEEEVNALPIPEPAAAAILLAGLGSMGWMRYRLG